MKLFKVGLIALVFATIFCVNAADKAVRITSALVGRYSKDNLMGYIKTNCRYGIAFESAKTKDETWKKLGMKNANELDQLINMCPKRAGGGFGGGTGTGGFGGGAGGGSEDFTDLIAELKKRIAQQDEEIKRLQALLKISPEKAGEITALLNETMANKAVAQQGLAGAQEAQGLAGDLSTLMGVPGTEQDPKKIAELQERLSFIDKELAKLGIALPEMPKKETETKETTAEPAKQVKKPEPKKVPKLEPQTIAGSSASSVSQEEQQFSDQAFILALRSVAQETFFWPHDAANGIAFKKVAAEYIPENLQLPREMNSVRAAYRYYIRNTLASLGLEDSGFQKITELKEFLGLPIILITKAYTDVLDENSALLEKEELFVEAIKARIAAGEKLDFDDSSIKARITAIASEGSDSVKRMVRGCAGSLEEFVCDNLLRKEEESEAQFLDRVGALDKAIQGFKRIAKKLVYDPAVLETREAALLIETIIINIIESQRDYVKLEFRINKQGEKLGIDPVVKLSDLNMAISDGEIKKVLLAVIAQCFEPDASGEPTVLKPGINLNTELYAGLNRLRINKKFYRYAGLLGSQYDQAVGAFKPDTLNPVTKPIFNLLFFTAAIPETFFTPAHIGAAIRKQLAFDNSSLASVIDVMRKPFLLKNLVSVHKQEMVKALVLDPAKRMQEMANIKEGDANTQFKSAKAIVQNLINDAALKEDKKIESNARGMLAALEDKDAGKIKTALQQLVGSSSSEYKKIETSLDKIVKNYLDIFKNAEYAIKLVEYAKSIEKTNDMRDLRILLGKKLGEAKGDTTAIDSYLKAIFFAKFGTPNNINTGEINSEDYAYYYQSLFGLERTRKTALEGLSMLMRTQDPVAELVAINQKVLEDKRSQVEKSLARNRDELFINENNLAAAEQLKIKKGIELAQQQVNRTKAAIQKYSAELVALVTQIAEGSKDPEKAAESMNAKIDAWLNPYIDREFQLKFYEIFGSPSNIKDIVKAPDYKQVYKQLFGLSRSEAEGAAALSKLMSPAVFESESVKLLFDNKDPRLTIARWFIPYGLLMERLYTTAKDSFEQVRKRSFNLDTGTWTRTADYKPVDPNAIKKFVDALKKADASSKGIFALVDERNVALTKKFEGGDASYDLPRLLMIMDTMIKKADIAFGAPATRASAIAGSPNDYLVMRKVIVSFVLDFVINKMYGEFDRLNGGFYVMPDLPLNENVALYEEINAKDAMKPLMTLLEKYANRAEVVIDLKEAKAKAAKEKEAATPAQIPSTTGVPTASPIPGAPPAPPIPGTPPVPPAPPIPGAPPAPPLAPGIPGAPPAPPIPGAPPAPPAPGVPVAPTKSPTASGATSEKPQLVTVIPTVKELTKKDQKEIEDAMQEVKKMVPSASGNPAIQKFLDLAKERLENMARAINSQFKGD